MIDKILAKMTLAEKIALCSGANFWQTKAIKKYGIPSVFLCDGPHGLRKQESTSDMLGINNSRSATCFPAAVTTANSWDTALLTRIGGAIAEEARHQRVSMVLGPGANIKRNPLCGRNFEYFSEDPYLTGKLAAALIRGLEAEGVGACLKHFACNSQERERFVSNSVMDERTLREIYLTGFELAVKEGKPSAVMCAYPKLNGVHCSDNKMLLTDILRDEWGFDGAVVTDWGAMNDRIAGFRAGCDLNMPGGSAYMEKETARAVKAGKLSEKAIDLCVKRVLRFVLRGDKTVAEATCDYAAHHALCEEAAIAGAVLLQNNGGLLPLRAHTKLAVIGAMAKKMRYQGAGSSHINAASLSQPLDFLSDYEYAAGCEEMGDTTPALLDEVRKTAARAEAAVVFVGLPDSCESEGFDRADLKLPQGQTEMIQAAAEANPNTVVVLLCGGAVECPWADSVKSILYLGLPGQAGGGAIAKLLYGEAVPAGKLAESWPYGYDDVPSSELFGKTRDALYQEGIYVGYRCYDKAELPVRWAFGHGLSYSSFEYSALCVENDTVRVTVKNVGEYDCAEIVQLFVCAPQNGIHRPRRELKGFCKLFLRKGESRIASFSLDSRCFSVYQNGWKVPAGVYELEIGGLKTQIEKQGETLAVPEWQSGSFYETCIGKPDRKQWETMLGRPYTPAPAAKKGTYTMDNTVVEMRRDSLLMKIVYRVTEAVIKASYGKKGCGQAELKMMMSSSTEAPLRVMNISGGIKGGLVPGLLEIANGRVFRGLFRMLKG